ncbi:trypsin-like peptidase domain-containing protein [Escherichia coli]|nr:trypsin-like peptidase domain-containing protein [Escherichia coli]
MKTSLLALSLSTALVVQGATAVDTERHTFKKLKNLPTPRMYYSGMDDLMEEITIPRKGKYLHQGDMKAAIQKASRATVKIERIYANEPRTLFTIPTEHETASRKLYTPILQRLSLIASVPESGAFMAGGSGFVIEPGYVLTARHVVDRKGRYRVIVPTGETYEARIIAYSQKRDIALLQIADSKTPALPLSWSLPEAGEALASVGYPGGHFAVKQGVVSAVRETLAYADKGRVNIIKATGFNLDHGHSGGPLVNAAGEVVGIAVAAQPNSDFFTPAAEGYESLIPAKGMCSI